MRKSFKQKCTLLRLSGGVDLGAAAKGDEVIPSAVVEQALSRVDRAGQQIRCWAPVTDTVHRGTVSERAKDLGLWCGCQ